MPSDKTFVTEVATGLGMTGSSDLDDVLRSRPPLFLNLTGSDWDRLGELRLNGDLGPEFLQSFLNGRSFFLAKDALGARVPQRIEWTGGRRPPGDEVVPADLRIDHVYLVSCKYLSRILHNLSPARLAIGLLSQVRIDERGDWFSRTAPEEYQELYDVCRRELGGSTFPTEVANLSPIERRALATRLRAAWPPGAVERYERLCQVVAASTAREWRARLSRQNTELMLWRLLRIGASPYFILGTSSEGATRLRIDTPWDWRQRFRLDDFSVEARPAGQALVSWSASFHDRTSGEDRSVRGHVEVRWSHGRFGQPPEAKVYLDSPIREVPGYHEI